MGGWPRSGRRAWFGGSRHRSGPRSLRVRLVGGRGSAADRESPSHRQHLSRRTGPRARVPALLFTPSWKVVSDHPIVSEEHVRFLLEGGRPNLLANARGGAPGGLEQGLVRHNVYQWDLVFSNDDIYKGGWAGQGLLVNPDRDLVAVWVGYFNQDQSELEVRPRLRTVLEGVFGGAEPPGLERP